MWNDDIMAEPASGLFLGWVGDLPINGPLEHWNDSGFGYPFGQPPLFVSEDLWKVLRWATELPVRERPYHGSDFRPGEFTTVECLDHFFGIEREHGSYRDWWELVWHEGHHTNTLRETGGGQYLVTEYGKAIYGQRGQSRLVTADGLVVPR